MWRILKDLGVILRELIYALIGQPSRPGSTRDERDTNRIQEENRQAQPHPKASFWDAAKQVAKEIGKASILQPSQQPRRKR